MESIYSTPFVRLVESYSRAPALTRHEPCCVFCTFTARRYGSVTYAVMVRLSIFPSHAGIDRNDWTDRAGSAKHACFLPPVCYKEVRISPKIRTLPPRTLFQTLGCENFVTASRSCCHQNSSTVEFVDHTYDDRRAGRAHSLLHVRRRESL